MQQKSKANRIMSRWPFTKKPANTSLKTLSAPTQTATPLPKLFRSITQIPLCRFLECDCDGNLRALIIEGDATEQELNEAWAVIKSQYADAMGNKKFVTFKTLFKQIGVMRLTLMQIELLINILHNVYHEDIAARLNKELKTSFQFTPDDRAKYFETLEACRIRSKKLKIDIDIKEIQYNAIAETETGEGEPVKVGREHYIEILVTLSNFVKYNIPDIITVYEFCERIRRYIKHSEQEKNKKNVRPAN